MKKIIFLGLLLPLVGIVSGCHSNVTRPEVACILKQIGSSYTPGAVGYEGRITHQDEQIEALGDVATHDELYQLAAADSVPMTRLAAFIALMKQRPDIAKNLALMDIQSRACVPARYGCDSYMESLANLRIEILQQEGRNYGLTKADSLAIDSCVLFTPHAKYLGYLTQLLMKLPPHPQYYTRVKALFLNDHYIEALVTLARYRKPEDVQYVLDALHGKVKDPIDVDAYWAEYERIRVSKLSLREKIECWVHPKKPLNEEIRRLKDEFNIHACWQYIPEEDGYNDAEWVKAIALQCVYENPDEPAFKPYLRAAEAYHRELSFADED